MTFNGGGNDMLRWDFSLDAVMALTAHVVETCDREGVELLILTGGAPSRRLPSSARFMRISDEFTNAVKELVAEANGKVMAFVSNQLDPLFESNDLKATGTGIYQEVFDTLDYDNASGADLVDTLLDGMESVGYTV